MKYLITMQLQSILTFFFLRQAANVCTAPEPQNSINSLEHPQSMYDNIKLMSFFQ